MEIQSGIEMMTPLEVSAFTRGAIKPPTLAKWRCDKRKGRRSSLPYVKFGGRVLYKKSDVEAFIASRTHMPGEPAPRRRRTAK